MTKAKYVFLNDEIVPWDQAKVHVATVAFKFGTAVFEGLRAYWNDAEEQLYLLLLDPHMRRLAYSQRFMRFENPIDPDYVREKTLDLLRANEYREGVHILATVFVDAFGPPATSGPVGLSITAAPRADPKMREQGCSAQVSSWQRVPDVAMPMRVKCNANYQNGRLASLQARADGYDTAILLNGRGKISEGPSMCFFMIRDGKAVTPTVTSDILESITRKAVIELLKSQLKIEVEERDIDRSELPAAEEAFYCGTAWEVTPIVSIDRLHVGDGKVGPVVRKLQQIYADVAAGKLS
ncbi:MAG TPA: aminotransferase class IV, partial [Gammaproteobacteria bacterium]|nr:aminotransferase class IV [Gammaproteobacteria bacterium]